MTMLKQVCSSMSRYSAIYDKYADELLRAVLMKMVLQPLSSLLPRKYTLGVAWWCGSIFLRMPESGRPVQREMKRCFGIHGQEMRKTVREYLAQPFYSFVVFQRILNDREDINDWIVEEQNNQDVVKLRESGRSFIAVTGHFRGESRFALHLPNICPGNLAEVVVPVAARSIRPESIRNRIHFGQILRVIQQVCPNITLFYAGDTSVLGLIDHLRRANSQVIISADAFAEKADPSVYTRPFAGNRARSFSVGTAILSRVAQCPIVPCATYVRANKKIVLEWGAMILPPQRKDHDADIRITDQILNYLESAIGRRPTQYLLAIGEDRRWNSVRKTWEDSVEERQ